MTKFGMVAGLGFVASLLTSSAFSQSTASSIARTTTVDGKKYIEVVQIEGTGLEDGRLALSVVAGPYADRSIRVVSQPSDTTLAVVVDFEYAKLRAGEKLKNHWTLERAAQGVAITSLPDGAPRLVIGGRPSTDDRIQVWVTSSEAFDPESEILIADGRVGTGHEFGFSTGYEEGREKGWPIQPLSGYHCCTGPGCGLLCIYNCEDTHFNCCHYPCCKIFCGWSNDCLSCE
jgi:hypothetical protein